MTHYLCRYIPRPGALMTLSRLFASLVLLAVSSPAFAEAPSKPVPVVSASAAVGYGVSMKSGAALPPVVIHGVNLLVPISGEWSYSGEVAMATTLAEFKPGLQIVTGPSKKLGDKMSLGMTGMYKLQPVYDGISLPMHIVGISAVPIFKTSFGALSFPVGVGYNVNTSDPSVAVNFKVLARL